MELRSAASDLGLHCLPVSLLWDARHKWVKRRVNNKWPTPPGDVLDPKHFLSFIYRCSVLENIEVRYGGTKYNFGPYVTLSDISIVSSNGEFLSKILLNLH